jgi:hypothetical protein
VVRFADPDQRARESMGPRRAQENGGALIGLTNNFGPFTFEDPFYVTRNFYDTGITLQPGVSVSIVYDLELLHQVAFATNVGNVNPGNHPVFFEPTTTIALGFPAAPWACTITGV